MDGDNLEPELVYTYKIKAEAGIAGTTYPVITQESDLITLNVKNVIIEPITEIDKCTHQP